MPLALDAGFSSCKGRRKSNEDNCLVITPSTGQHVEYGALLALADGVGGLPGGADAAACAVKTLCDSYYSSPEGWSLEHALKNCFDAANQAVLDGEPAGRATTLSALVLRNRRWIVAHVGDTRVWLYRDRRLAQLTDDHARVHVGIGPMITRACGLDVVLHTDVHKGELCESDLFLITSDGVHQVLAADDIAAFLQHDEFNAQELAEQLTQAALDANSMDNASVCAVRIVRLPAQANADFEVDVNALAIRPLPASGDKVDGFVIGEKLHSGRMSTLYKVVDSESNTDAVLKFPNPRYANDNIFIEYFLREEWIGRRIKSPYVANVLALRPGRRTCLYSAMAFHGGQSLAAYIKKKNGLPVAETLALAQQILTGLDHLHRQGVIHRDIKPENILIDEHQQIRLLDLGVSLIERMGKQGISGIPIGTPSYMAPEVIEHQEADERSDIYSVGVTLYEMLTGRYPYGEIEPFTHPKFTRFMPAERYNPDVPAWLSDILKKACAPNPTMRFGYACDMAAALASPPEASVIRRKQPLIERITPEQWRLIALLSLAANVLLLFVYLF